MQVIKDLILVVSWLVSTLIAFLLILFLVAQVWGTKPTPCHAPKLEYRVAPQHQSLTDIVIRESQIANINPNLIMRMIAVESSWQTTAASKQGARGLMQIMPHWQDSMLCPYLQTKSDFFKPDLNIRCGIAIVKYETWKSGGSLKRGLQRYNGSIRCMSNPSCYRKTEQYALNILKGLA